VTISTVSGATIFSAFTRRTSIQIEREIFGTGIHFITLYQDGEKVEKKLVVL
jgi:hypothetical protein